MRLDSMIDRYFSVLIDKTLKSLSSKRDLDSSKKKMMLTTLTMIKR